MAYTIIKAVVAVLLYDDKSYFCQAVRVSSGAAIIIKKGDKHDRKKNYNFESQLMASHYKVIFSRLDVWVHGDAVTEIFSLLLEQIKGDHAYALGVSTELIDAARQVLSWCTLLLTHWCEPKRDEAGLKP